MKYHIGWQRFVEHLNFQAARDDLSLAQSEALAYMQSFAGYNRKTMKRVPKSLLDAYVELFMGVPTTKQRENEMTDAKISDRIAQAERDMVLTDVYWATVNGLNEDKVNPEKVLVLVQYILTAYLSTIPDMTDVQVQVLELLRQILPKDPLPEK